MRSSTIHRYNLIHSLYNQIMKDLGELRNVVSKSYIYGIIKKKTKLSIRTISHVLNHTREMEEDAV